MIKLLSLTQKGNDSIAVYELTTEKFSAKITNYGCTIMSLCVPDRNGNQADIVLGFDTVEEYMPERSFFGAFIGRFANRIRGAHFVVNGKEYRVPATEADGTTSLHGGSAGFDTKLFAHQVSTYAGKEALVLTYNSPDGEMGYPGNLTMQVIYTLDDEDGLRIVYRAVCDQDTPLNVTNHSFFNLRGHGNGIVHDHVLTLNAKHFTPTDASLNTLGTIAPVAGTALDFTTPHTIGERVENDEEPLRLAGGYDHNFVIDRAEPGLVHCANVYEPESGRVMDVYTDTPGVQLYTGNFLKGQKGKGGATYVKRGALCLETQYFPNCVNTPYFPSCLLKAGQVRESVTIYRFSAK